GSPGAQTKTSAVRAPSGTTSTPTATSPTWRCQAMPQHRDDPYLNFNFRIEAVAYREGADKTSAARMLPGRVEFGPVVLRRGFAGDPALFQWCNGVVE